MYEIKLCKRDNLGNAIPGKFLEFTSDDAGELAAWYERNAWRRPSKRKKKKKKKGKKDGREPSVSKRREKSGRIRKTNQSEDSKGEVSS